jgi:hypothetical protein
LNFSPRRHPKAYDGSKVTSHHLGDLLPALMKRIGSLHQQRGDLILAAWPELIGPKLAGMTEASSFQEGVLHVKVMNSSLYSLLRQQDGKILLKRLRDKFPKTEIKTILFRLG